MQLHRLRPTHTAHTWPCLELGLPCTPLHSRTAQVMCFWCAVWSAEVGILSAVYCRSPRSKQQALHGIPCFALLTCVVRKTPSNTGKMRYFSPCSRPYSCFEGMCECGSRHSNGGRCTPRMSSVRVCVCSKQQGSRCGNSPVCTHILTHRLHLARAKSLSLLDTAHPDWIDNIRRCCTKRKVWSTAFSPGRTLWCSLSKTGLCCRAPAENREHSRRHWPRPPNFRRVACVLAYRHTGKTNCCSPMHLLNNGHTRRVTLQRKSHLCPGTA